MAKETKITLPLSADLLEKLANFQEIELQDVIIDLEEIELNVSSGGGGGINPVIMNRMAYEFALIRDSAARMSQAFGGVMPTMAPIAMPIAEFSGPAHAVNSSRPPRFSTLSSAVTSFNYAVLREEQAPCIPV